MPFKIRSIQLLLSAPLALIGSMLHARPAFQMSKYMPGLLFRPHTEPNWRPANQFSTCELDPQQRIWLLDDGSLTGRLISSNSGHFSVERLHQSWSRAHLSEQTVLAIRQRQRVLVREVVLKINDTPVVFARSLFPVGSLSGRLRHLRHLRNRSLGSILFRFPQMQRSPFEIARIAGNSAYLPAFLQQSSPAWGRRSCFTIDGRRLLVSEVFLQNFKPWQAVLPLHRSQRGKVNAAILQAKQ
ncbi:MAG: chorismate--pyruvate lyase family protein [Parahaliea sp.]